MTPGGLPRGMAGYQQAFAATRGGAGGLNFGGDLPEFGDGYLPDQHVPSLTVTPQAPGGPHYNTPLRPQEVPSATITSGPRPNAGGADIANFGGGWGFGAGFGAPLGNTGFGFTPPSGNFAVGAGPTALPTYWGLGNGTQGAWNGGGGGGGYGGGSGSTGGLGGFAGLGLGAGLNGYGGGGMALRALALAHSQ